MNSIKHKVKENKMINITPTSHYSTNFKAKTDYSKIYKEMEKISVRRDEKIIPKVKIKDKFTDRKAIWEDRIDDLKDKWHNKWETFHFNVMRHFLLPLYVSTSVTLLGVAGYMLIKPLLNGEKIVRIVNNDTNINSQSSPQNLEKNLTATADSLETLLNDSTISFEEYRKQMNDAIEEYDVKSHIQLFNKHGMYSNKTEIKDLKTEYTHNAQGQLMNVCEKHGPERVNINCSQIDAKIKEYKERVQLLNPNKDEVLEEDMSKIQNLKVYVQKRANYLEKQLLENKISLKEYEKAMEKMIEEYDVYAHLQLFKQNGFRTHNNDIQKIKHGYAHDNYGHLIAIDPYRNKTQMTNIDCSKVDKNIEILNKKLDFYKSKEINDSIAIELE